MARGSITLRPLKDGATRYRVKWESRGPDGKRRYHSETVRTKKQAEKLLTEKLGEVEAGTFVPASKETVGTYLDRWLDAAGPSWTESTVLIYGCAIRRRLRPYLGDVPLVRLDELTIQECYSKLEAANYSARSVMVAHSVLSAALEQAVKWRLLPRNPAVGLTLPAVDEKAPAVWTAEEAAAFLVSEAKRKSRYLPLWRLGLDSGMRLGEMLALAWSDVELDKGVVAVRRTLTRTKEGGWQIGEHPKTKRSRRSIALGAATVVSLRALKAPQAERRLRAGPLWRDLGLVFDRGDGGWFNPVTVQNAFERAVSHANVPRLTPHGMRHTMATLLLGAGVHPKVVQERLGHASISMTLDTYSHIVATMQREAADLLDSLLEADGGDRARPNRGHSA